MTVVVDDQIRELLLDGGNQFPDPFRSAESAVVLYAEDDVLTGYIQDLLNFTNI